MIPVSPLDADLMTSALLVIDMQQGLCTGEWAAHDIERVLQRINDLIDRARAARDRKSVV